MKITAVLITALLSASAFAAPPAPQNSSLLQKAHQAYVAAQALEVALNDKTRSRDVRAAAQLLRRDVRNQVQDPRERRSPTATSTGWTEGGLVTRREGRHVSDDARPLPPRPNSTPSMLTWAKAIDADPVR